MKRLLLLSLLVMGLSGCHIYVEEPSCVIEDPFYAPYPHYGWVWVRDPYSGMVVRRWTLLP